jgi:hypothetical protein
MNWESVLDLRSWLVFLACVLEICGFRLRRFYQRETRLHIAQIDAEALRIRVCPCVGNGFGIAVFIHGELYHGQSFAVEHLRKFDSVFGLFTTFANNPEALALVVESDIAHGVVLLTGGAVSGLWVFLNNSKSREKSATFELVRDFAFVSEDVVAVLVGGFIAYPKFVGTEAKAVGDVDFFACAFRRKKARTVFHVACERRFTSIFFPIHRASSVCLHCGGFETLQFDGREMSVVIEAVHGEGKYIKLNCAFLRIFFEGIDALTIDFARVAVHVLLHVEHLLAKLWQLDGKKNGVNVFVRLDSFVFALFPDLLEIVKLTCEERCEFPQVRIQTRLGKARLLW